MNRNQRVISKPPVLCEMSPVRFLVKIPIHIYRWTLKPFVGQQCRHLPTCSDYALQSIDVNGSWRGIWLIVARLARCHPWGTSGYDPVPDVRQERHFLMPWRYGRWGWRGDLGSGDGLSH